MKRTSNCPLTLIAIHNNRRKKGSLIKQYGNIFSNISDGLAFPLQGVTENDSS